MFLFSGSQVSEAGRGTGLKAMANLLPRLDVIIISPTPASSPASSEFHRLQPLIQPPVRFSKQEKLKVGLSPQKSLGILTLYNYFKHVPFV